MECRVDQFGHLGHAGKDIFFGVAIDQHAQTPPCAYFFFYPYSTTLPAFFHTVTFPSLVHMVSSRSTGPISHRILVLAYSNHTSATYARRLSQTPWTAPM